MPNLPVTRALELEFFDGWLTIWFNQPQSRNALSSLLQEEVLSTLDAVKDDRSVRGIVFRGRGDIFCTGGDLKAFSSLSTAGSQASQLAGDISKGVSLFMEGIKQASQITVAVVQGAAMAGGFGVACACDVVITRSDTQFSLTETRLGMTAVPLAPIVIDRLGFAAARHMMLFAEQFSGTQALNNGMADYLFKDEDELESILNKIKAKTLICAPGAVALTKQYLMASQYLNGVELNQLASNLFSQSLLSEEGQEGFSAFLERRKPGWTNSKSK